MPFIPFHILYNSTGVTPVYTFENVTDYPSGDNKDPKKFIEKSNTRGNGSIFIEGGNESWDFSLEFYLRATSYEGLMTKIATLKSTIVKFTTYVLKIQTGASSTINYTVKRIIPIDFPISGNRNKRVTFQRVIITFKVLSVS